MRPAADVLLFPQDPSHRLVGDDLAAFLDRLGERLLALGDGAVATVRAGRFRGAAETHLDLVDVITTAREAARGRADLEVILHGDVRDAFARFIGARTAAACFRAFLQPTDLEGAYPCLRCGWPLEGREPRCPRGCPSAASDRVALTACWSLTLSGTRRGAGLGPRFVAERRRLEGTPFFSALQGTARTSLFEWQP